MWDETVNDDIVTDIASIYSERFNPSRDYNAALGDKYQIYRPTDNFLMKQPQCTDIMGSTINGDIEQNDSNLSPVYSQYQIDSRNSILDRCSSPEESLCTECGFGNRLNKFFASINTTQEQAQRSCFPSVIGDQCDKRRLVRKRSFSVSPKNRNSELHMRQVCLPPRNLKKFKSEGNISTIKNTGSNIWALIRPTHESHKRVTVTHEISLKNSTNIDQMAESSGLNRSNDFSKHTAEIEKTSSKLSNSSQGLSHFTLPHQIQSKLFEQIERVKISPTQSTVQDVIEEVLVDENTSNGNETNRRSIIEMKLSQSQNLNTNDSNCINTGISRSTIEKIHHYDITDEINELKTVDLIEEMQETDTLKYNNSQFDPSTIEEVYHTDAATDIGCLAAVEVKDELHDYLTAEKNPDQTIINKEIIQKEKIMGITPSNKMDTGKLNPLIFSCKQGLKSEIYAVYNTRTEDNLHFQCMNEIQLKSTGREMKIAAKNIGSVHPIDDPVTTVHSAKDPQFSNGEISEVPEDSILEITIASESDSVLRQNAIIERGGVNSVHLLDNLKRKSTISKAAIKGERDTRNGPIDLISDTNSNHRANVISSKEDDSVTSSLIGRKLQNIGSQVGMATKRISSINLTGNSATNINSIKYPNTLSNIVQTLGDDLSLEFLSETDLQRIENDAHMKAKGAESATNSSNENTKGVANEQDLFYRPERLNMINKNSNDGLVIPNWVMSPSPQPNYDKIKSAIQMRRRYMKKMLQEIHRLSTIVSEIGSIVHAGDRYSNSEAVPQDSLQIQGSHQIHYTEMNDMNRSVGLEASGSGCGNLVPEDGGIFYVPHSNRFKYNAPCDKVTAPASTARTVPHGLRKDLEGNSNFYAPGSNRSKYNTAIIFNGPNGIEFNGGNVSSSCMQSNASNIFGSSKHDLNGNRTCEPDISEVWHKDKGSETGTQMRKSNNSAFSKNKEYLEKGMKVEYQSPKTSSNATVPVEDGMGSRMNKFEPVDNDTIFYLPDKLSSASNNYTMENSQTLGPVNLTKRLSTRMKVDEPRPPNFGKRSAPPAINDDNSIFYKSNKKREATFNIL